MLSQTAAFLILCHHKSAPYQPVFAVVVPFIDGLLRVHMSAVRIPILRSLDVCGVRERRDIIRGRQRWFMTTFEDVVKQLDEIIKDDTFIEYRGRLEGVGVRTHRLSAHKKKRVSVFASRRSPLRP